VVDIEQINPRNEAALRAWWEVGHAATADRPGKPWPLWEQSRVALPAHDPERDVTLLGAIDGRAMVGAAMVVLPASDNRHLAGSAVYVDAARRRRGIGSSLLAEAEVIASGHGRTTMTGEAYLPPAGTVPAEAFAAVRGFSVANRESIKELAFADYRERRETLSVDPVGYRIVTFDTVCPDDHVASLCRLLAMLLSEIPLGDLDLEASEWSAERVRAAERRRLDIGRRVQTALAITPDGEVVGISDVRIDDTDHEHAQVGVTLVDPAHRGHRLGLALKLASHDLALATYPTLERVDTSNAEVNTHMNAVNEALGYRTIETLLELQKKL
jgi:GNAT superfamily N-acetyltransferase